MKFRKASIIILGCASIIAAAFSVSIALREYTAFRVFKFESADYFINLEKSKSVLAFSTMSDEYLIRACMHAVNSVQGRLQVGAARNNLWSSCLVLSEEITRSSSQNALAWYLQSYLSIRLSLYNQFDHSLVQSYQTAPNEQWIAELRVQLAESALDQLSARALSGHERDLALLVQSRRGIGSIARRYVNSPEFRDRITEVVVQLPDSAQQRFVDTLRIEVRRFENAN